MCVYDRGAPTEGWKEGLAFGWQLHDNNTPFHQPNPKSSRCAVQWASKYICYIATQHPDLSRGRCRNFSSIGKGSWEKERERLERTRKKHLSCISHELVSKCCIISSRNAHICTLLQSWNKFFALSVTPCISFENVNIRLLNVIRHISKLVSAVTNNHIVVTLLADISLWFLVISWEWGPFSHDIFSDLQHCVVKHIRWKLESKKKHCASSNTVDVSKDFPKTIFQQWIEERSGANFTKKHFYIFTFLHF